MNSQPALILGARSDMGKAIAHDLAASGHPIQLAARHAASLAADKADLELRYGVLVTTHEFDALALDTHVSFVDALPALPHVVVCAVGLMGEQAENERDPARAVRVIRSNFEGPAHVIALLANRFEQRGSGVIVGISSVAGERGRAKNYVYGAAKSGMTAFLSGLRNRLATRGVHVMTVLPGFVATRMTEGMLLPARLTAQPSEVARAVTRGIRLRRDVIYVRSVWRLIMLIIRAIPERKFKTMNI